MRLLQELKLHLLDPAPLATNDDFIAVSEQNFVDSLSLRLGLSKEEEQEAIRRANLQG